MEEKIRKEEEKRVAEENIQKFTQQLWEKSVRDIPARIVSELMTQADSEYCLTANLAESAFETTQETTV